MPAILKLREQGKGLLVGDRDQQSARRLRIEGNRRDLVGNFVGDADVWRVALAIAFAGAGNHSGAALLEHSGQQRQVGFLEHDRNGAALGHLQRMTGETESRDVGGGVKVVLKHRGPGGSAKWNSTYTTVTARPMASFSA